MKPRMPSSGKQDPVDTADKEIESLRPETQPRKVAEWSADSYIVRYNQIFRNIDILELKER